jgi:1-acyl-sn-glycerol-3-phosphate acyltransferase
MKALLSKWFMALCGWKVRGVYTEDLRVSVVIVAPHTSNWDFIWGILARNVYKMKAKYLIKNSFFKPGIAWFFRWTGGIAVDRSKKNDLTTRLKSMINSGKKVQIVFTPEGTRKHVDRWKSGFYWVAFEANLPIVMHAIDYKTKIVSMNDPFYPTGDWEKDKKAFEAFYADKTPCNAEGWNTSF